MTRTTFRSSADGLRRARSRRERVPVAAAALCSSTSEITSFPRSRVESYVYARWHGPGPGPFPGAARHGRAAKPLLTDATPLCDAAVQSARLLLAPSCGGSSLVGPPASGTPPSRGTRAHCRCARRRPLHGTAPGRARGPAMPEAELSVAKPCTASPTGAEHGGLRRGDAPAARRERRVSGLSCDGRHARDCAL